MLLKAEGDGGRFLGCWELKVLWCGDLLSFVLFCKG